MPSTDAYLSIGKYDSLDRETGYWKETDSLGKVIIQGEYKSGVRVGVWRYSLPTKDSFIWNEYVNYSKSIRTNIPEFLKIVEEGDSLVIFESKFGERQMQLLIGNGYLNKAINLLQYRDSVSQSFIADSFTVLESKSELFETKSGLQYIYNYVVAKRDTLKLITFNIAGITKQKKLVEVTLRCDERYVVRGSKIFFSVFPNLFIESDRFSDSRDDFKFVERL